MFELGQRVVCINDKFSASSLDEPIRYDEIYTVRWVGVCSHYIDGEYLGLRLEEVDRGKDPGGYAEYDMPYSANRFKPLVLPKSKINMKKEERA